MDDSQRLEQLARTFAEHFAQWCVTPEPMLSEDCMEAADALLRFFDIDLPCDDVDQPPDTPEVDDETSTS